MHVRRETYRCACPCMYVWWLYFQHTGFLGNSGDICFESRATQGHTAWRAAVVAVVLAVSPLKLLYIPTYAARGFSH